MSIQQDFIYDEEINNLMSLVQKKDYNSTEGGIELIIDWKKEEGYILRLFADVGITMTDYVDEYILIEDLPDLEGYKFQEIQLRFLAKDINSSPTIKQTFPNLFYALKCKTLHLYELPFLEFMRCISFCQLYFANRMGPLSVIKSAPLWNRASSPLVEGVSRVKLRGPRLDINNSRNIDIMLDFKYFDMDDSVGHSEDDLFTFVQTIAKTPTHERNIKRIRIYGSSKIDEVVQKLSQVYTLIDKSKNKYNMIRHTFLVDKWMDSCVLQIKASGTYLEIGFINIKMYGRGRYRMTGPR